MYKHTLNLQFREVAEKVERRINYVPVGVERVIRRVRGGIRRGPPKEKGR